MSLKVHFLNGGYCRQFLASVDGRSLRLVRFHAVFLAFHHPTIGWVVCDTGYGGRFRPATRAWPYRLYRYATPVRERGTAAAALARIGVDARRVQHVIVTHFHADHIGGLGDFPSARVYYHEDALQSLAALKPFKQTSCAFLPSLVPAQLQSRSKVLSRDHFQHDADLSFPVHDLFRDGSLRLVHLPGHAPGQLGVQFEHESGPLLYAADAYWRKMQVSEGTDLPALTRKLQWDPPAYDETIARLRHLHSHGRFKLLACHDDETQSYLEREPYG